MTEWSERLPNEEGYYWVWTGKHLDIGLLQILQGVPASIAKTLTTYSGVKAPIFNGRLFNGWQIGDRIENPKAPEC